MLSKFVVGDKVRVLSGSDTQYEPGTVLTVMENDMSDLPYYCRHEDGTSEWMYGYEIEISSTATNQLEARVTALESELAELKASLAPKVPIIGSPNIFDTVIRGHLEGQAQPGKRAPQTANELRKAAIKLAQESVAESFLTDHDGGQSVMGYAGHNKVEFVVDSKNRTVVALLRFTYTSRDKVRARGIAKCDPTDVFNEDIGKAIALDRALGRVTAVEILRAPNPTDIVVGMLVEPSPSSRYRGGAYIATKVDSYGDVHDAPGYGWANESRLNIIADTGAKYE